MKTTGTMKKYISMPIIPVLFAAAALMPGCIKDTAECAAVQGDQLTLTIALPASEAVATYATESGSAAEDRLDDLYVTITPTSGPAQDFTVSMSGVTGTPDANGHRIYSKNITVPYNTFKANDKIEVRANYASPETLIATPPASPFYMSGVGKIAGTTGSLTASVHLVRGVAKIRTGVTVKNSKILLNGVSVKILRVPAKIREFAPYTTDDGNAPSASTLADPSGLTYVDYASKTLVLPTDFSESFTRDDGTTDKAWPQYVYENWLNNESGYAETGTGANVTTLEVTMQLQDQITGQTKSHVETIPIRTRESTSPDTYTYRIKRNHIYAVDVQVLSFETVKVNVDILPWKEVTIETVLPEISLDALPDPIYVPRNTTVTIPVSGSGVQKLSAKLDSNVPAGYSLVGADPATGIWTPTIANPLLKVNTVQNSLLTAGITIIADNVRYKTNLQLKGSVALNVSGGASFSGTGGSGALSVTSYIRYDNGSTFPLPWRTEYSIDGGSTWSSNLPSWLTGLPASGSGSTTPVSHPYTVASAGSTNPHTAALRSAIPVSNYDLSTNGGTAPQNTANCYVVNAPGTYRLPLVYGNAIKNNANNTMAYMPWSVSSTNVLGRFLNHRNVGITAPKIKDNAGCVPTNCCLVWQDADGLVTNVRISGDEYLEFEVPQAAICQGNAIVAVRDASNQIMWSWHIWVTDYKLGTGLQTITNYQGVTYRFLPFNVGWCDPQDAVAASPAVSVLVRIVPDPTLAYISSAKTAVIARNAVAAQAAMSGNNPYFQWGRKDPMFPGLVYGVSGVDKSYFNSPGYEFGYSSMGTSINSYIQNPHRFNVGSGMDNMYYNLWSADNTVTTANDNPVVKTVYDPSPVGFCMPPSNAWTGFTTTGNTTSIVSQIRGTWDSTVSPAGYKFDITGGTAYFPASGYRYYSSGALDFVGGNGFYWSAVAGATNYGRGMLFFAGYVSPLSNTVRSGGFSVRPIKE